MDILIGVPASISLALLFVQYLVTKRSQKKMNMRVLLIFWASLVIVWMLMISVAPRSWFTILSAVPEREHQIEDGMLVFLVMSLVFAIVWFIPSFAVAHFVRRDETEELLRPPSQ